MENKWNLLSETQPPENETVWLCNPELGYVTLGCRSWQGDDGWVWAYTTGSLYSENGRIVSECDFDDEQNHTHWKALPNLPEVA